MIMISQPLIAYGKWKPVLKFLSAYGEDMDNYSYILFHEAKYNFSLRSGEGMDIP